MAELASGILGPAIEVVKWVGAPIKRQLSYLCCFTCNVATLKDEAENLDYQTRLLQDRVDKDKNDGHEEIYEIVEKWLTDSGNITRQKDRILAESEAPEVVSSCSNFAKRVSLSKKARKTAEAMVQHIEKCKFESVSPSPPIAATSPVLFGKVIYKLDSRKRFEEDIMKALKDMNVDKVGICGIGGVGKTVVAQEILNRALKEGFDEIAKVTVSQPVEKLVIQKKIAELLGLTLNEETLKPRADQLRARLMQKKRTLILLDDVWEVVNLEELGIPCDGEWCTIILTSRRKDVLKGMKVENVCELGFLREDEAWDFFIKMTGTCVDDVALNPIAKDVMRECKGLLVALETLGKAHEDEKRQDVWRDSLQQLRKHNPVDIPNFIKEVYRPLKLSYDRLESENAKSTILLCCLFAEDADIPLEHLTYFAKGLRLFDETWELEGVRGRIRRSIDTLRNRCLLLDSSKKDHVRMHDVVRDVSIFIASEERRVKCSDCTWISSHVDGGARLVPPQSCFPKLKLLFMNNKAERDKEINIVNLIAGSSELSVLFIEEHGLLKSLPVPSLKTSLTTLVLRDCESLESIAVVGQLESLEILICHDCNSIKELPGQVKGLKHLKLLQISDCIGLKRVAAGVKNITSAAAAAFPLLEDLSLQDMPNFEEIWDDDAPIPSNSFRNLKRLKLYSLPVLKRMGKSVLSTAKDLFLQLETIDIFDCEEMEELVLVPREEEQDQGNHISTVLIFPKLKRLYLRSLPKLRSMICSRGIESIQFPLLAKIYIKDCGNLKRISDDHDYYHDDDSSHLFCGPKVSFPNLKKLILANNKKSEKVWCDKVPIDFFRGLVELNIGSYYKMRRLFSSSSKIPQNLVNLQRLVIYNCTEMVKVIEDDEEVSSSSSSSSCDHPTNPTTTPLFPSLQEIWLLSLPKLESFCEWRCADLELPSLKKLWINYCREMKSFNAAAGSLVITPALQTVRINRHDLPVGDDLNAALHQQFEEAKKRKQEEEEGNPEGNERNGEIEEEQN